MKTPAVPGSGRQGVTNSNSSNTNSFTTTPPPHQELIAPPAGRDGQELIAVLAELFPAVFVAERWEPHKPLKICIHQDLIECGVLKPYECRAVFRRYCSRLIYQQALAAGGPRYGLNGEPAGEVTAEQMAGGKLSVASIEAKRAARAKVVAAEREPAVKAAKPTVPPQVSRKVQPAAQPVPSSMPSPKPGRLGLAELKAAALARREAATGLQARARNCGSAPVRSEKVGG